MTFGDLYDQDFYAWTQEQAALLQTGNVSGLDTEHLAEEVEDMGRSVRRELRSHLVGWLVPLKWTYQPEKRSRSWTLTLVEQRLQIESVLTENPTLRLQLPSLLQDAYKVARVRAARETDLPVEQFPETCMWTVEEVLKGEELQRSLFFLIEPIPED